MARRRPVHGQATPVLTPRRGVPTRIAPVVDRGLPLGVVPGGRSGMVDVTGGYPERMSAEDKARNKVDQLAGKAKETVGRATRNRDLEAKGKGQQTKGNLKQAGEKVKDAFK